MQCIIGDNLGSRAADFNTSCGPPQLAAEGARNHLVEVAQKVGSLATHRIDGCGVLLLAIVTPSSAIRPGMVVDALACAAGKFMSEMYPMSL